MIHIDLCCPVDVNTHWYPLYNQCLLDEKLQRAVLWGVMSHDFHKHFHLLSSSSPSGFEKYSFRMYICISKLLLKSWLNLIKTFHMVQKPFDLVGLINVIILNYLNNPFNVIYFNYKENFWSERFWIWCVLY